MLVIDGNPMRRAALSEGLRRYETTVRAVAHIADVEHWPIGEIVVTDLAHLSPLWKDVGASHVVVVVDEAELSKAVAEQGATAWIVSHGDPNGLAALVLIACGRRVGAPASAQLMPRWTPKTD